MTEAAQIIAAVAQARDRLPNLPDDYASRAIAAGKTVDQVKSDLIDMMSESPRERGKALMRAEVGRQGLARPGARGGAGAATENGSRGVTLMAAELRRQGIEPRR